MDKANATAPADAGVQLQPATQTGEAPMPVALAAAARQLRADGAADAELDAAFRAAVIGNPLDRLILADWMDLLLARESPEAVTDLLVKIQAETFQPIRSVLIELRDMVGVDRVRSLLGEQIERFRRAPAMEAIADIWNRHLSGAELPAESVKAVRQAPTYWTELYFAILAEPSEQLALFDDRPAAEERFRIHDVRLPAFRSHVADLLTNGEKHDAWLARAFGSDEARLSKVRELEAVGFYKYRLIEDGNFALPDPFGDEVLYPIDSLRMFGRTIYTFRGATLFYLICGNMGNDLFGIYVPEKDLSISFTAKPNAGLADIRLVSLRAQLLSRICRAPDAFLSAYREGGCADRKRIVFHLEKTENFAHHLWNFYSSLDHVVELGLIDKIDRVVFSGTEFFGPLDNLFPELSRTGVERPPKNNIVDPCPFSRTEMVVGAGSIVMGRTLPQRVIAAARRLPPTGAVEPGEWTDGAFPIVWLGMRLVDKSWVAQEQELPKLIDAIAARHPNALFLLDGFSVPVGQSAATAQWSGFASTLATIAERVRAACAHPDRVIDLVGNSLRESVLWAAVTDVYLAPLGTTQHKVGWLTDAPGIVYASPSFEATARRTPGAWAAEISPTPDFVIGAGAGAGQRRGVSRTREKMENVLLDTNALVDRLLEMIEEVGAKRTARAGGSNPAVAAIVSGTPQD